MTTDLKDKAAVEHRLWEEIATSRFGMLATIERVQDHFQPMTAYCEPESGRIWFYARNDSDIAAEAQGGAEAMFVFVSKDQKLQASIRGELRTTLDLLHRDKFWNATVAAWFAKGKDDVNLTMLCLDCQDTQVWISDVGGLRFGWEIARANLTGNEPNIGGRVSLDLG
jgi:general stress protein 26